MKQVLLFPLFVLILVLFPVAHAASFAETPDITIEPDFCSLYPITVSSDLLSSPQPDQIFTEVPLGTGPGNYSWLTWQGENDVNTLADSLIPPGNSHTYRNPDIAGDVRLDVGDWIEGAPGVKNSGAIRERVDALLGKNIIVPVWDTRREQGANHDYHTARFAVIALTDYRFSGKGHISFVFKRFTRCYNHRPVALASQVTTLEDVPVTFTLHAEDADGNTLQYEIEQTTVHGTIDVNGNTVTYYPQRDYFGSDSLTFTVNDGEQLSNVATVSITVLPVNDRPVADDKNAEGLEDTPILLAFSGADIEGDSLTFRPAIQPANGSVESTGDGWVYRPAPDYHGTDVFTYVANDGELDSEPATYTLTIVPVNDPPVVENIAVETESGKPVAIALVGHDVDSEELTYRLLDAPVHGAVTGTPPELTYTSDPRFDGAETLHYVVSDGELESELAEIHILVKRINEPPVIVSPPPIRIPEQSAYLYQVLADDPNNDPLVFSLDRAPAGMTIGAASGAIHWLASPEYTQSVPTFNSQCYVVPTGAVKVYEEGDENASQTYIAPLFHRVRAAIHKASEFTAPAAVDWHNRNRCLGCHIQTQSLLGLQASKSKADVDEQAAEYLLTEILASQQSDGSIRRSHPQHANNQTAFALWALTYVPEKERTLETRRRALAFFWARRDVNGSQQSWNKDHDSGWLRSRTSITALVTQAAVHFIDEVDENPNLPAAYRSLADQYRGILPALAEFMLAEAYRDEDENLFSAFRLIALAELKPLILNEEQLDRVDAAISHLDALLRSRQEADGGWNRYQSGNAGDPLTSAWVGIALNYQKPAITDPIINRNIEFLLDTQQPSGTWVTNSGLFSTHLATTSLVMAYLPVALDHLGNPDVRLGNVQLNPFSEGMHLLSVELQGRGLSDVDVSLTVSFFNGLPEQGDLLGEVTVEGLASGVSKQPAIVVAAERLTDDVSVTLTVGGDIDECEINNNTTRAALVRVRASDPDNLFDTQVYTLNVEDVNAAPVIDSEPVTELQAGQSFNYTVQTSDVDVGDAHTFTLVSGPEGLYLDPRTGRFISAPGGIAPGEYEVVVQVEDLRGAAVEQRFTLVIHQNLPPEIVTPPVEFAEEGSGYRYDVSAVDPNEGDVLSYAIEHGPVGVAISRETGVLSWLPSDSFTGNRLDTHSTCLAEPVAEIGNLQPVEKWRWTAANAPYSQYDQVMHAPIAVPLYDTNGDGEVTNEDDIAIVFQTFRGSRYSEPGYLRAVWADTGEHIWTASSTVLPVGSVAAADIDGDGFVEIIAVRHGGGLRAFSHSGEIEWDSETRPTINWGGASIADIDNDGVPEVIAGNTVFDNHGRLKWQGTGSSGNGGAGSVSFAADLDLDGYQEVIAGGAIYRHDGQLVVDNGEGLAAVGNFDDDDFAEIVVVSQGRVFLYEHDGTAKWPTGVSIPGGGKGGAPTVADMTGDGVPEIGVAGANNYAVFNAAGSLLWSSPTRDHSSNVTGSSVFDFNGDGRAEVVYGDEYYLRIYDGPTGEVIYEVSNTSGTTYELPVVADVDHDGHAEIIVIGNNYSRGSFAGVRVFEDANDSWAPTRSLWNQHAYSINNINDDLTVPGNPIPSWLTHNTFRLNTFPDRDALALSDLTVFGIAYDESAGTVSAKVKNRGLAPFTGIFTVEFFHEHFWTDETALGAQAVDGLKVGEVKSISIPVDGNVLTQVLRVDIVTSDDSRECATDNNDARAPIVDVRVYDEAGLFDSQKYAISVADTNDAPAIASAASSEAAIGLPYQFQVEVTDPDRGDAFAFALVDAPEGLAIHARTGLITAESVAEGVQVFTIRATDLSGVSAEQVHLLTVSPPGNLPPAIESTAPDTVNVGETYSYNVVASDPDGDEVVYLLSRSQPRMTIDGVTGQIHWTPTNDDIGVKSAEVTAMDEHGATKKQYFLIQVVDPNADNHPPSISSAPQGLVYVGQRYEYSVVASDPDGDSLSYAIVAGQQSDMNISDQGLFIWLPAAELAGEVVIVEIEVSDGRGGRATQKLSLPVNEGANSPPLITSTPEQQVDAGNPYAYAVTVNDADGDSYTLVLDQAPNGMTLSESGQIAWTPSSSQAGQAHDVILRATDARGAASTQSFGIAVNTPPEPNEAPAISSQPTSPATANSEYRYQVLAVDADNDALTYSLPSAPTGMSIDAQGLLVWTPADAQVGDHSVAIQVSDGRAWVTQSYILSVVVPQENNTPPSISSVASTETVKEQLYQYPVSASDAEGDPISFNFITSPQGMTVDAVGLVSWTPTADQVGSHTVQLVAQDDKGGKAIQTWSIAVSDEQQPLTAQIYLDNPYAEPGSTINVTVWSSGGTGTTDKTLTLDGTAVALGPYGNASITAPASAGSHQLFATVSASDEEVTVEKTFTVTSPDDTVAPLVSLLGPSNDSVHTTLTTITATVQDDNLLLYQVLISPRGRGQWQVIAEGSGNLQQETIATLDPSLLLNGQYDVAVRAEDINGRASVDSRVLVVDGDLKVGNFSITLEDLNIPVAGIPIRVTRTYDSRRRAEELDFGYGWSVGYQGVKVEESRTPGSFWAINQYNRGPYGIIADFCIEPLGAPVVTVTLPNGDIERFEVGASPHCNTYQVIKDVTLSFTPVGNTQSTLEALDDSYARYEGGTLLETGSFARPVNPSRYKLTTQAGYEYYLKQDFGIDYIVDPNGHTLTYTNDGIFHSSGKAVRFVRDSLGRITRITDPNGNALHYQYDNNGDLIASTDAAASESTYTYNRNHGLLDIIDPLGRRLIRNIYDDDGQLIAQEDSDGNRTDFNHDIEGRQSVVTDRNGHTTLYYYDERGNVTTRVDAAGHTWHYSYDARGNQLSETDPQGNVTAAAYDDRNNQLTQTDALGNITAYTYNTRGQELTLTDALGNTFTNTYDSVGNLLTVTDPEGNVAGNHINIDGLVSKTVDAEGNETTYTYDSDGNKLTETDALGNTTRYSYDANGNVPTETRIRTVNGVAVEETTAYVYDARNRMIETHYPDGTASYTEYDVAGNEIASVDALGRRTEMDYDAYGRLIEIRYPDGSFATKTYDREGNLLNDTDRLGRTTYYTYDALNRVVRTDYPDGTFISTAYDAAGRVMAETDARVNSTTYEYDAAGRRTARIDSLGSRHSYAYDANGNLISETDANGHTTDYVYNSLDQRIESVFADDTRTREEFDALGRRTARIDQADRRTEYGYDALGRLTEVRQFLGDDTLTTAYSYDEASNKLTQTDADGRVTRWTYDSRGRQTGRTLPLGQTETFDYDANGNRIRHTDFKGQFTSYTYDLNDRVTEITYADGEIERFTYDTAGNRASASNGEGMTAYQYDSRNRLTRESQPSGAVLTYSYDANSNRTALSVNSGGSTETTRYAFDALSRLQTVTDSRGSETRYTYDPVGNRASIRYPNGLETAYTYGSLNRLTRLTTQNGSGATVADYEYTLGATGRRTAVTERHNGRAVSYGYDELYRLTTETVTDPTNGNYSAEYQYDRVGNRTLSTIDGVQSAYQYDANDRLTQRGGTFYTYDANGNTLRESGAERTTTYTYNAKNKLIGVTTTESTASFGYNPDGIRSRKTEADSATDFIVDSNRDYAQVLSEMISGTSAVHYTYGDDLLSQDRVGQTSYYVYDGHGSTRALADQSGSLTDGYHYDAFGNALNSTGSTENSYLYAGEQLDRSLNQYYLRARYYDQGIGRFTQLDTWQGRPRDPITLNKYLYV